MLTKSRARFGRTTENLCPGPWFERDKYWLRAKIEFRLRDIKEIQSAAQRSPARGDEKPACVKKVS